MSTVVTQPVQWTRDYRGARPKAFVVNNQASPIHIQIEQSGAKGRVFSGLVLAMCESAHLWEMGGKGDLRPLMMVIAASEQEARPLLANLRLDGKARLAFKADDSIAMEIPKRGGDFEWSPMQPLPGEAAVAFHVYRPATFSFIPPVTDPDSISFAVMPGLADIEELLGLCGADEVTDALAHVQALRYSARDLGMIGVNRTFVGLAAVWASYLERRTIWAIPQKLAFRVQLLLAMLKHGVCSLGDPSRGAYATKRERPWWCAGVVDYHPTVVEGFAMHTGVGTVIAGKALAEVLSEEVRRFDTMRRGAGAAGRKAA